MSSDGSTKQLRKRPAFFEAKTRRVDIDAHLIQIKRIYADDFSALHTAVAPPTHPPFTGDDQDNARTRLAGGSNPPMSAADVAVTTPMAAWRPPPPPEPTQVRLLNPDNRTDTGPTRIRVGAGLSVEKHPPIIEPTEIRVLEPAAEAPPEDANTELQPTAQPEGPYCPVGAPQLAAYQIVRKIATGGMGIVYEGYHRGSGQRVAVKYMRRVSAAKAELVQRFLAEAVAASRVEHPGVAEVYDYGHDDDGVPYLVMEYLEGECLADRLSRGALSPSEFATISTQIALILEAAHRAGIVHRDLKPDNIFLLADSPLRIKVLDFGVAKFQNNDLFLRATKTGQMLGTPYYMSPEQCAGSAVDQRSDVYALGCVMYQMLTGRMPFTGNLIAVVTGHRREKPTPIVQLNSTAPEALIGLIEAMMAKKPDRRPASMAAVADALETALDGPPPPLSTPSLPTLGAARKLDMGDTLDSVVPDPGTERARTRIGFPLALVLTAAGAVSLWLSYLM